MIKIVKKFVKTVISSMLWKLLAIGMSGSWQCWPVEGMNTPTDLPTLSYGEPPDMISPDYKKLVSNHISIFFFSLSSKIPTPTSNITTLDQLRLCRSTSFLKRPRLGGVLAFSEFLTQTFRLCSVLCWLKQTNKKVFTFNL